MMVGRFCESTELVCIGIGEMKAPPWAFAGFICCCREAGAAEDAEPGAGTEVEADVEAVFVCEAEVRSCCVEASLVLEVDVAATGLVGLEVEGSGLLSLVLFFLRKPREGMKGRQMLLHTWRGRSGEIELNWSIGDRVEVRYARAARD